MSRIQGLFSRSFARGARLIAGAVLLCGALLAVVAPAPRLAHADGPITSNPYVGPYASPNCTWYAWQRLHDTEHVDLQFSADAGYWITFAEQLNSAWDEVSGAFVQPKINTEPAPGDVAVLPVASTWANPFHVAYVESVNGDGTIEVSEQSYGDYSAGTATQPYPYVRHKRWDVAAMQQAEQGQARFLHFGPVQPQPVDDFQLAKEVAPGAVALNQPVHVALQLLNTGNTTWAASDGYTLSEMSTNCVTCTSTLVSVGLQDKTIAPRQTWNVAFDLPAGSGQMCASDVAGGVCTTANTQCASPCYFLPQFVMLHGTSAFGPVLPLSVTVQLGGPVSSPTPATTVTPGGPTPTATATAPAAGDAATAVGQSSAPSVQAGQRFAIYFIVQNTGSTTWSDAASYTLACTASCMGANTVGFKGQSVAPGQQYQLAASLIAPTIPGTYHTGWTMEDKGAPFGPALDLDVTVSGWSVLLRQPAPACDSPIGTTWFNPLPDFTQVASCGSQGYLLAQTATTAYAETDLQETAGQAYDQSTFLVRVKATFENPTDINTYAALIVQTPQDPKQAGGYIFAVTAQGQWRLQAVSSDSKITTVAAGAVAPGNTVALRLLVQGGTLYGSINDQPVVQWSDSLGDGTELGVMVENDLTVSSPVAFTEFELSQWLGE